MGYKWVLIGLMLMKNKYLELFNELKKRLDSYPNETNNQRYLRIMLERRLKNLSINSDDNYEPDKISRKIIYAIDKKVSLDEVDSKEGDHPTFCVTTF